MSNTVNPSDTAAPELPVREPDALDRAKAALLELGHDVKSAESTILHLLNRGIVFRTLTTADTDIDEVKKEADEVATLAESDTAIAPEVKAADSAVDKVAKVADEVEADAKTVAADGSKL